MTISLCAGHSLGGALATLAAHSFATAARARGQTPAIACYTFGAPRTGNVCPAHFFCCCCLPSCMTLKLSLRAACLCARVRGALSRLLARDQ